MKTIKTFSNSVFSVSSSVIEVEICKDATGKIVNHADIIKIGKLGFDISSYMFELKYRCIIKFRFEGAMEMTLEQLITFRDMIDLIERDESVTNEMLETLKPFITLKFVESRKLVSDLTVTLPNNTSITIPTSTASAHLLGLIPDEYLSIGFKPCKLLNYKIGKAQDELVLVGNTGKFSIFRNFLQNNITAMEDLISPPESVIDTE